MSLLLRDLRGGPDIPVLDGGSLPQGSGWSFYVIAPAFPPPCGEGLGVGGVPLADRWTGVACPPSRPPLRSRPPSPPGGRKSLSLEAGPATVREALAHAASIGATGVVLPGTVGTADIEHIGAMLAVAEAEHDLPDGSLSIVAIADKPAGVLALASFRPTPRLAGLACDPTRLAAILGCDSAAPPIVTARGLTILAAGSCGVPAILVAAIGSPELCREARREGFGAVLTREPG